MLNKYFVTVLIATRNRCESLKDTLGSLLTQESNGAFDYEIIVVDNNSSDKTKETIVNYQRRFDGKLIYLFEAKRGKSHALNRGMREVNGEIIAFTDDDCIIDSKWLLNIVTCFQKHNCDGVGGKVVALIPHDAPAWIQENKKILDGPLVDYEHGEDVMLYDANRIPPFFGANFAFKKEYIDLVGLFRTDLGPGQVIPAQDNEFFQRVVARTKNLYYCGGAIAYHKTLKKRTTFSYIIKWYFRHGRYRAIVEHKWRKDKKTIFYFRIPRPIIGETLRRLLATMKNIFRLRQHVEDWTIFFYYAGQCYQYMKLR